MLVSEIKQAVAAYYGVSLDDIHSASRKQPLARHRQVAIALSFELSGRSSCVVGNLFGRDHSTVLHAAAVVREQEASCPTMRRDLAILRADLTKGGANGSE